MPVIVALRPEEKSSGFVSALSAGLMSRVRDPYLVLTDKHVPHLSFVHVDLTPGELQPLVRELAARVETWRARHRQPTIRLPAKDISVRTEGYLTWEFGDLGWVRTLETGVLKVTDALRGDRRIPMPLAQPSETQLRMWKAHGYPTCDEAAEPRITLGAFDAKRVPPDVLAMLSQPLKLIFEFPTLVVCQASEHGAVTEIFAEIPLK